MFFVKRIILLFVIFHTTYYVCKGAEFDSAVTKVAIVSRNPNESKISVTCDTIACQNGGKYKLDDGNPVCDCTAEYTVDNCKIPDFCEEVCGTEYDVNCEGDKTQRDKIKCTCKDGEKIFNGQHKKCEGKSCVSDGKENVHCKCPSELYNVKGISCKVLKDACNERFQFCIQSGGSCVSDGKENIHCNCPSEKTYIKGIGCKETCDIFNSKCENGGECEERGEHRFCNCKKGTSGDRCEIIADCKYHLYCRNDVTYCSYDTITETAFCKCKDPTQRYDVVGSKCIETDRCILKMIKKECTKENEICEGGECKCKENYKYSKDNKVCEEDKCSSCPKGSLCGENTDYSCQCNDGEYFDGRKCVKYDNCEIGMSKCEQKCDIHTGKCACEEGFILSADSATCETTNEISICDDSNCHPGICVQREDKQTCICPGVTHKLVNNSCIDICTLSKGNPPKDMHCPEGAECERDSDDGIRCKCEDPYEQADDGIHCKRKEMCKEQPVIQQMKERSALCREIETGKGYNFYCDKASKFDKDGVCRRKCEFKENDCLRKFAVCELDQDYNAVCRCPPLLTKKGKDGFCSEIAKASYSGTLTFLNSKYIGENESYQHLKGSTDIIDSTYYVEIMKDLKAAVEYVYGDYLEDIKLLENCESLGDLFECKIELQLKNNLPDVNTLANASYCYIIDDEFCLLQDLVVRRGKSLNLFQQTDPCILEDMFCDDSTTCKSDYSEGTFKCACKEGFSFIRSFPILSEGNYKEICSDIDECQSIKTNKCPENTTCINTYGSYICECNSGFRRKDNILDPKRHGCEAVCDPNPCENEGECIQTINRGFICRCKPMYSGVICNETVAVKEDDKCVTIIGGLVGTALALFFIIVVIVFVVVQKMKINKKNDDDRCRRRQQCASGDVIRVEQKENEYVEIDLHSNTGHRRQNNVELREVNIRPRVSIPRAHISRDNNADQHLEDRSSTYDVPRKYSDVRSEEDKIKVCTMEYPNKAYGLEE